MWMETAIVCRRVMYTSYKNVASWRGGYRYGLGFRVQWFRDS